MCAHALLAWRTVAWLLWYVKVATVVLLMTEYNNYNATKTTTLAMAMATVGGRSKAGREGRGNFRRMIAPTKPMLYVQPHQLQQNRAHDKEEEVSIGLTDT